MGAKRRDLFLLILLLGILTSRADAAGLMDGPSSIISQATGMAGGLMGKGGPTGMLDQLGGLGGIMGDGGPMKYLSMVKGLAGGDLGGIMGGGGPMKYLSMVKDLAGGGLPGLGGGGGKSGLFGIGR
ncbi:uncharacterized protein LOC113497501 isoform X2 [Trichoplusia ni]|uniref:Uncharacterized protein LOC113497501 isoform X2 n=1 Tax=Trichoplusia ni TaxID=7111 RepID=A0A7E5VXN1_TRINI|nr:uncharacterized protein LOC113497501 isoform X2 [Trichoplusia ni]